jgi:hypothetical protein
MMTEEEYQRPGLDTKNTALSVGADLPDFMLPASPDRVVSLTEFHNDFATILRNQL